MAKQPKILFVLEDSKEQGALQKALDNEFALDFCYDAADAAQHIGTTRPDVVVLSYQDEDVSPLALAHIVRQDPRETYVGLVYISQTESNDWLERLLMAGVDVCLPQDRTMLQTKAAIDATLGLCRSKAAIHQLNLKLHSAYQRLKNQSYTDSVTGLGNRRYLQNQLRLEFKRAQRYQKHLILILLRLDELAIGPVPSTMEESLLTRISETIGEIVRFEIDFTGRSGESEFFVILPETDIDGAIAVAERMRTQIAKLHEKADGRHLASSVGVVHYNGDRGNFRSAEEFYRTAEAALQAAQKQGGDQYWALDDPSEAHAEGQSA